MKKLFFLNVGNGTGFFLQRCFFFFASFLGGPGKGRAFPKVFFVSVIGGGKKAPRSRRFFCATTKRPRPRKMCLNQFLKAKPIFKRPNRGNKILKDQEMNVKCRDRHLITGLRFVLLNNAYLWVLLRPRGLNSARKLMG